LREDNPRAWLFTIVRNTWYSRISRRTAMEGTSMDNARREQADEALDPEAQLLQQHTVDRVRSALEQLPADFREVIVLREIEGLGRLVRSTAYYSASDLLRARVSRTARRSIATRRLATWAAAAVLLVSIAGGLTLVRPAFIGRDPVVDEVVSGHVRSLMADHL